MARRSGKKRKSKEPIVWYSDDENAENRRCSPVMGVDGFQRWCETRCYIVDKSTKRPSLFRWFHGQARIAPHLVAGTWLCILKGRQLGVTTLIAAFVLWVICYRRSIQIIVVFQEVQYAEDFIESIRDMYDALPRINKKKITTDNIRKLVFGSGGNQGEVRALTGSRRMGRSLTADILIGDEASRIPFIDKALQGALPALDIAGGQAILLSTSAGPQGIFHETWMDAYGEVGERLRDDAPMLPIFLHWSERPGRDQAWYDREDERLRKLGGGAIAMKQEHPNDPQEAWEFAEGRVYTQFTRARHIGSIEIPTTSLRYRAIDWGQTVSPHVCLWIAHVPGPPGLLIHPDCVNTIREMFAYRWDEDRPNWVLKRDDHCPDALRYAVMTYNFTGLVYVYREWYVPESVQKGWSFMEEIHAIHEMTGWELDPDIREWLPTRDGELIQSTVADRSWPKAIKEYNLRGKLNVIPHRLDKGVKDIDKVTETPAKADLEVLEGIRMVCTLIDAKHVIEQYRHVDREMELRRVIAEGSVQGITVASTLRERALKHEAARLLAARKRIQRGRQ